jgi:hypothetical protein
MVLRGTRHWRDKYVPKRREDNVRRETITFVHPSASSTVPRRMLLSLAGTAVIEGPTDI